MWFRVFAGKTKQNVDWSDVVGSTGKLHLNPQCPYTPTGSKLRLERC